MKIEHDSANRQFVARTDHGEAVLGYGETRDGALDLQHTFVPEAARGDGVGEALVRRALSYARDEDRRIIPSCPFVRSYLDDHPDDAGLVAG